MSPVCSPVCSGIRRFALCILLLSGLCSCLHHYHFIAEPKTWDEAQEYCRKKYTDLATVDNMTDMEQLIAAAGPGYEGKVWIGLRDFHLSWGWSMYNGSLYRGNDWNFRKWSPGEPNDIRRGELCVVIRQGVWYDYQCNMPFPFVCYDMKNIHDLPPTAVERYFFINTDKSWYEAQVYCRMQHTDLASVRNETENESIQQVVPTNQPTAIGLNRHTWIWWSDGASSLFTHWDNGHPRPDTGNCAASVIDDTHLGKWVENDCQENLHFMCHNKKKQMFYFKLTALKSTVDLNDPDVTAAILNQFEEKMKNKGISRDVKIAWNKKPEENVFHKQEKSGN
ncbi:lymphocyte antigen 75-like [Toxotes jaculatrix]|uniref:lymphocyte antigen 75-like n=1 Tax=Toxotes jaculatrix TaxID=941984 RepID=UPI001B3ADD6D|nr:lymphocyte antigen 75-like [Toxotes jaculatrix]